MIVIGSLEQQLSALKTLLCISEDEVGPVAEKKNGAGKGLSPSFTNDAEDLEIAAAIEFAQDEKQLFMQDIFKDVAKEIEDEPGS